MSIETGIELTEYAEHDYKYVVGGSDVLCISYVEDGIDPIDIGFGTLEEMEAVAKAMLKFVEYSRDTK